MLNAVNFNYKPRFGAVKISNIITDYLLPVKTRPYFTQETVPQLVFFGCGVLSQAFSKTFEFSVTIKLFIFQIYHTFGFIVNSECTDAAKPHPNNQNYFVDLEVITLVRTLGARTPLAFKNSPPFASERSPSLRSEVQPAAKLYGLCLQKLCELPTTFSLRCNNNAAFKKRGEAAPAFFRKKGDRREAVVENSLTAQAVLKSVPKAPY